MIPSPFRPKSQVYQRFGPSSGVKSGSNRSTILSGTQSEGLVTPEPQSQSQILSSISEKWLSARIARFNAGCLRCSWTTQLCRFVVNHLIEAAQVSDYGAGAEVKRVTP